MANEDLIYRITRAVYERLGPSADEQMVEQLVTDIYREVNQSNPVQTGAPSSGSSERMVISVFGWTIPESLPVFRRSLPKPIAVSSTSTRQWCRESLRW